MKSPQTYITILAAASLALTGNAQSQSQSGAGTRDAQAGSSMSARSSSSLSGTSAAGIHRVTKDSVEAQITAKDLIGAGVYDPAGEKIGDIADIGIQGSVPATLAHALNSKDSADRTAYNSADSTTRSERRSGDRASLPSNMNDMMNGLRDATIYVSVGGLWGIGDDLVSVPASELSYNAAEERFQMSVNKADVVALAEQKGAQYAGNQDNPSSSLSETAAAKQSFADEATRVHNALRSDPATSAFATKIRVTADGETLELHGTLESREQQQQALAAARRATSFDVEDKLDVR